MKKLSCILLISLMMSCIVEKSQEIPHEFTAGIMTLDEGNYMASNASMTGYNPESLETIPDLFSAMAGASVTMGDSPTSIYEYNDLCYISMSGSGKIYVFDPNSCKLQKTISGLSAPRYMYAFENTMWVSDLYNTSLTKIDLATHTVAGKTEIGGCAEMLIPYGNYIFTNLWNIDRRIARIDISTGNVVETLEIGIQPYSMAIDRSTGILWVYCDGGGWEGNPVGFENPSIYKIDISSNTMRILKKYPLDQTLGFSFKIAIGTDIEGNPIDNFIYFTNKHIYRMDRNAEELPSDYFINGDERTFYAIAITSQGEIYAADAGDYISDGKCYRFDKYGLELDRFQTGISPGFIFINK